MINQDKEFLGIDKDSGFSLRVLILSVPAGLIFMILALFDVLSPLLAAGCYICILFFNTVFLMPISVEIQQVKKYIQSLSSGASEEDLLKNMTEKETRDLTEAINSMHKFWIDKAEMLENRTLSDAAVLDTLPDPLVMINQSGIVIGANLAARLLFAADLNNKAFEKFVSDAKFNAALKQILEQKVRRAELNVCLIELKNKPKFYVRLSTLPWFAKGEVVAVSSFYDLNKALKFEQMQQDFVANASHELRTPLSIISGFVETLQTTAKDDEKARDKFLKVMGEQAAYMSALIENLLSLSKVELTVNTLPEEKVNINTIIREIKNALELKIRERGLIFKTQFARLPQVTADISQLTQVLQNLLDNAVKYALPETTVSVVTTKVESVPPHQYYDVAEGEAVEISIANVGVTIAPMDLERLTERFYRLQQHKNQNIKGTGLGLAIAAQIIKRHRGNMVISSEDGVTTFKVYLPLVLKA
ncbi:MAG: ATP-binding protein [Acetobacter sp.]|nr:ATP-binding protein [Acetobacter sp.]